MDEFRLMRNCPYGRATGFHSTEIDYSKVEKIIFQDHRAITGAEWVVSDVKLVKGEKELNEIMKMTKDEFFPFIDKYGQFKYLDWPGKIESDKDLQKAREAEEKDLAAHTQMQ